MKILIFTQVVDIDDPVLGFFHRWLEMFSREFEQIDVICLKKGTYSLPPHVRVWSLGKEEGRSKLKYVYRFYTYLWKLRKNYDAVFVHMNEEYVMMGGLFWMLSGKKTVLWRNFKTGSWMTPIAAKIATVVCYTSPESFTARFKNRAQMPIGIDTDFFSPLEEKPAGDSILFLGRTDRVKKVELFVEGLKLVTSKFQAAIYGDPTYPGDSYVDEIKEHAELLVESGMLILRSGVTQSQARDLYREYAIYVNVTPSGSFDKTIGEAMSSGCIVVCANGALQGILPSECIVGDSAEEVAHGLEWALLRTPDQRQSIIGVSRAHIQNVHSLALLARKLSSLLQS